MNGRWIIFDGDNTLWDVEHLYDEARKKLCENIASKGFCINQVESFQRKRDKYLYESFGYSKHRFAQSFIDTANEYIENACDLTLQAYGDLAREVFQAPAPTNPDADLALRSLSEKYHLAILTAGDEEVQQKRLNDFNLKSLVDVIRIVKKKDAKVFRNFSEEYKVNVSESWVVGDSLKSDIKPAKNVGFNTVWFVNHNWTEIENVGHEENACRQISSLGQLIGLL